MQQDRLRIILDVVQSSLDDPDLSARDLAGRAYLSRYHFDRLVRAALGEPPAAFRRRLLLERSAHVLAQTDSPVIDVAQDSGFGSPEAYTRAFARAYGCPPSAYRRAGHRSRTTHDLPAPSRIHFRYPGGLVLPADQRSTTMDVLLKMADHHLDLVGQILDRGATLGDEVLDRPIVLSVEGIDEDPTLRTVSDRLVSQLEMWNSALDGGTAMPTADETFLDAICEPPETFSLGGVLAHVLTFSAVRRTTAIGALETAGITDLGAGDPMHYVGGSGEDAHNITRTRTD